MSIEELGTTTNNQAHFGYDYSKLFIRDNQYYTETLKNLSGGQKVFEPGTIVGMITADASGDKGKIIPLASAAADGSAIPVGVLKTRVDLADTAEAQVSVCVAGHVASDKLVFDGADTIDTFIPNDLGKTIKYRLLSDTMGIKVIDVEELSQFDNQ